MPHDNVYSDEELIRGIRDAKGNVSLAAELIGCSRRTIHLRIESTPAIRTARDEARRLKQEDLVDLAEGGLYHALVGREAWAIKYTLSSIGKERGYTEKSEVGLDGDLNIAWVDPLGDDDEVGLGEDDLLTS